MAIQDIFNKPIKAINVGMADFATSLRQQGVEVVNLDWRPPLGGYVELHQTKAGLDIDQANQEAVDRIRKGRAHLVGMGIAGEVIPGMRKLTILHAGPPITWDRMCGPLRGAVIGAILYEGWRSNPEDAAKLAASGEITFEPCHAHHAVGPMAGVISPSMPVFIVKNEVYGCTTYASQNEGLGRVLRYGAYGSDVIERLHWMKQSLYPALSKAIEKTGPIDLRSIIAQALHMGDETHNRNRAATSLFFRLVAPSLVEVVDKEQAIAVMRFIDGNDHFFLNLSMAACKAMLEPAENIPGSTVVTVMARNGTDFGIRVSSLGDRWFTAPSPIVEGLWLPGFTEKDANPDLGDSAITETFGVGGFAMASAPAIVRFVGSKANDALQITQEMAEITVGEHEALTIPALDFRGCPLGIDLRKVMATGILPCINTGIAHREAGVGMVGAGLVRAPKECFESAFEFIKRAYL